ncbi:MAG: response regulator [Anaerolineae bacterium]|nr:response regulator [Phycisphaerae bacterium]
MILIIDDLPDAARAICALISHRGYPCRWISNGRDGLAVIRTHPAEEPLLVVLDYMMPDMSGTDVLEAIRLDAKIARTMVMFHSAGFDVAKRDAAMSLGAVAWMLKGTDPHGEIDTICNWYERAGGVAIKPTGAQRQAGPRPAADQPKT